MARPRKKEVNYFPHYCKHDKESTIDVLEKKYNEKGYAFWFKLLETLGRSPGYYLDFNNKNSQRKLLAKTFTTLEEATDMFEILVDLDDIDKELWKERKVVWCRNFINELAPIFRKRGLETPAKPSFRDRNPRVSRVSDTENALERERERKRERKNNDFLIENLKKLKPEVFNKDGSLNKKKLQTLASGTQGLLSEEYARQVLAGLNEA